MSVERRMVENEDNTPNRQELKLKGTQKQRGRSQKRSNEVTRGVR